MDRCYMMIKVSIHQKYVVLIFYTHTYIYKGVPILDNNWQIWKQAFPQYNSSKVFQYPTGINGQINQKENQQGNNNFTWGITPDGPTRYL